MIILFTRHNPAGALIAQMLVKNHGFAPRDDGCGRPNARCWERDGIPLIDTGAPSVLEVPTDFETDCIIVLSTHKSRTPGKMLTAHVPGNWGDAGMGGSPKTLNIAHAAMLKRIIRELETQNTKQGLGWPVSLEADHHGPTCDVPILFAEIGNGEEQWRDESAAEVVASAVANAIFAQETGNWKPETVFCAGGGHYARAFTRIALETDFAPGHIAPKYAIDKMDEGMFRQAIEKNVGKVTRILILRNETNLAQKNKIRAFAEKAGLPVELI